MTLRIGQGFDIHPLVTGRPFMLGGVDIEASVGPSGHSDGDALLHAITDALLGATGQGDIGEWFSDNDPQWKGADSTKLLSYVWEKLHNDGWKIENIDTTVILEAPKLKPHKATIKQRIAALLSLNVNQVSIKAKTAEKMLGELGQAQAIAVHAVVLLSQ